MGTKVKNLQMWCKKITEGYRDVEVKNMTSSWKDGLALCAMIHRFRPDLIDYDSLSKENVFDNNNLAFELAEREFDIPALLDAADMVAIKVPDRLSMVTYVSQYYNYFHNKPQLGGPGVKKIGSLKRAPSDDDRLGPETKRFTPDKGGKENTPVKKQGTLGDKCVICGEKVYLLERQIENGKLYHRQCFRQSDLSPTSKIYARPSVVTPSTGTATPEPNFWQRRAEHRKENTPTVPKISDIPKPKDTKKDTSAVNSKQETKKSVPFWKKSQPSDLDSDNKLSVNNSDSKGAKSDNTSSPIPSNRHFKEEKGIHTDSRKIESMDVAETNNRPKPTPRGLFKKTEVNNTKTDDKAISPLPRNGRVKSPVSGLSSPESPPPPLPSSIPPPLPTTLPPTKHEVPTPRVKVSVPKKEENKVENKKSAPLRPKSSPIVVQSNDTGHKTDNRFSADLVAAPRKPPRLSGLPRDSPMDIDDIVKMQDQKAAVLVSPTSPQDDKNVLSGLLKNLAGVRKKDKKTDLSQGNTGDSKFTDKHPSALSSGISVKPSDLKKDQNVSKLTDKHPSALSSGISVKPSDLRKEQHVSKLPDKADKHPKALVVGSDISMKPNDLNQKPSKSADESNKHFNIKGGGIGMKPIGNTDLGRKTNDLRNDDKSSGRESPKPRVKAVLKSREQKSDNVNTDNKTTDSNHSNQEKPARVPRVKVIVSPSKSKETENKDKKLTDHESTVKPRTQTVISDKSTTKGQGHEKMDINVSKVDDNLPEWKKRLEESRKAFGAKSPEQGTHSEVKGHNLSPRAEPTKKSTESSNDTKSENKLEIKSKPARPKTPDIIHKKQEEEKPLWQIEAEKRAVARKGVYTDPEKERKTSPVPSQTDKSSDKLETKRKILPAVPAQTVSESENTDKRKKVALGMKFDFGINRDMDKSPSSPPPRPPPPCQGVDINKHKVGKRIEMTSPSRDIPSRHSQRRKEGDMKRMSPLEIQKELMSIDSRLTNLELRGRHLEDSIRKEEEEDEDMMVEWFFLVNEKNELVRKEADLIYASRAQELEDEQQDIDKQIRELMQKPDEQKTDAEREEEALLLQKLVDVVNQRSLIVDSQDEDRLRYEEEDKDIAAMLTAKGFSKDKQRKSLGIVH